MSWRVKASLEPTGFPSSLSSLWTHSQSLWTSKSVCLCVCVCVCVFVGLFWVDSFLALGRAVILGSQTEAHCRCCESVFTLLWLACFICVSLTGQFYLSMFDRLCFCVVFWHVVLDWFVFPAVRRREKECFFGLKGNYSSILNEFHECLSVKSDWSSTRCVCFGVSRSNKRHEMRRWEDLN